MAASTRNPAVGALNLVSVAVSMHPSLRLALLSIQRLLGVAPLLLLLLYRCPPSFRFVWL